MRRWCLVLASVLACSDRSKAGPPSPQQQQPPPPGSGSPPPFSVADAVRLFEAVAACTLEPHGLDHMCPARNALDAAYGMDVDPGLTRYDTVSEAARKVLGHASPSVRVRAFDQLDGDKDEALLVRALGVETDAMAVRAMIFHAHTGNPAILDAVLALVAHPVPDVRIAAMRAIAAEYNVSHPGIFEAIVLRIAEDADLAVRADACLRLGLLQDPRSVAVLDRMLVAATPPALFDAYGQGLVYAWLGDAENEHPVEAAYRRTLTLLRKGPHRRGAPGTLTLTALHGLTRGDRTFDNLPPWVDVPDARDALAAFAASAGADPEARRIAGHTLAQLEPGVAELRRYAARIRDRSAIADELREHLVDAESWVDDDRDE
jgi:hypothetical protein